MTSASRALNSRIRQGVERGVSAMTASGLIKRTDSFLGRAMI